MSRGDPAIPALLPDFIIVGAAKCGTTALFSYLSTHSGVACAPRKEPYYWCPDIPIRAPLADPAEYANLWRDAPPTALRGEATPAYIRSEIAIPAILAANPSARFIFLIRKPAEMAASFHAQMLVDLEEDVGSFERAWHLQDRRARGRSIPGACFNPRSLQYAEVCALGDQLERFLAAVPQEQRLVLLFDDLAAAPRSVYVRTLAFLGLADDGRTIFEVVNRNRKRRAPKLARLYGAVWHRLALRPWPALDRLLLAEAARPPLPSPFEQELHAAFRPQVEKIETLLGCDLSHWKTPPTPTATA